MKHRLGRIFIFLVLLFQLGILLHPLPAHTLDAKITDFFITHNTKDILVYFRVEDCFTKKMDEAILAGIPTAFTYLIQVYQEGIAWNSQLAQLEIRHTIKYDNVRNVFYVSYSEQGGLPVEFRDFQSAKRAMTDVSGIAVAPIRILKRESQYFVKVKAKLAKTRMPLHMEYVLFFVSMWDFETDWYKQGFVYK